MKLIVPSVIIGEGIGILYIAGLHAALVWLIFWAFITLWNFAEVLQNGS